MTVCRPNHATKQRAAAWWFGLLVALVINPILADTIRLPESSDAWLEDTFFLDSHNGWCVGRQGVIWRTDDGGQHWQLQHAEPHVVLHCVYFLDGNTGWAVGGRVHPLTWQTSAVILRTTSGGRRWTPMEAIGLPELRDVHFFNENEGIAAGLTSSLYTTGIVRTEDGGRSWIGVAGVPSGTWSAATFSSTTDGLLVGGSVWSGGSGQSRYDFGNVWTTIFEVHAEYEWQGLKLRALYTQSHVADAGDLTTALNTCNTLVVDGKNNDYKGCIAKRSLGGYFSVGYNVLPWIFPDTEMRLEPFYRFEWTETQNKMPSGVFKYAYQNFRVNTVGLQFYPHPQVVIKADYRNVHALGRNTSNNQRPDEVQFGIGYIF